MTKRPTAAQLKVLALLDAGGRYCTSVAVYGYGFSVPVASPTMQAIKNAGWVGPMPESPSCYTLTDSGRSILMKETK